MAVYYEQWLKKLALSGEKHLLFARIEFKFENGILKIKVPKVEESENKKLIEIE